MVGKEVLNLTCSRINVHFASTEMHYFQNSVILLILLTVGLFVKASDDSNDGNISEQEVGYAKGSLCGYCTYCKVSYKDIELRY